MRRHCRGEAMIEFLLMLPVVVFIAAMSWYLAQCLNVKEDTQIEVRERLWEQAARHGWWYNYNVDNRRDGSWTAWDPTATGSIGTGATTSNDDRPRGTGEELTYLYEHAGDEALGMTDDQMAQAYFRTIWNNLCGRHHCNVSKAYPDRTEGLERLWQSMRNQNPRIETSYYNDSPTWVHGQMPIWLFAQFGPMEEIRESFETHLALAPPEFKRMAAELLHAWFQETRMLNWNDANAQLP